MKIILFMLVLLFFVKKIPAKDFGLSGYAEFGRKSTAEDYQEEDYDLDYKYENYHLKVNHKASDKFNYDLRTFLYKKKYNSQSDLDNVSRIFKSKLSYSLNTLFDLILDIKYREKKFEQINTNNFNQFALIPQLRFEKKDNWLVNFLIGFDNYNYLRSDNKDQLKYSANVKGKKYFQSKKLVINGSYRFETLNKRREYKKRAKHNIMGGILYDFDYDLFDKITIHNGWGYSDTKDSDDRDIDYDYKYFNHYTKTEHKLSTVLKTNIKYSYFKKDYININLDHRGYYLENKWYYELFESKRNRIWFNLDIAYKDVEYTDNRDHSYRKEYSTIHINFRKKKYWKASFKIQSHFYQYSYSAYDKSRYYAILSVEKFFLDNNCKILLDLKYRYMDYKENNDSDNTAIKIGYQYKF